MQRALQGALEQFREIATERVKPGKT
jgi:hypothetical protein